jgi:ubiquinone/menaquinone biosynthesis C-methylase UbiE
LNHPLCTDRGVQAPQCTSVMVGDPTTFRSPMEATQVRSGVSSTVIHGPEQAARAIRWPVSRELTNAPQVKYRNRFAEKLSEKSVDEIVASYVYLSISEMAKMLELASNYLPEPLAGAGIELGAGCGLLASLVARWPGVEKVLALEICASCADLLIPRVAAEVLGKRAHKVVPIVGSFDDLRLPDNALDFAVEIDSFHHSDNLDHTLRECARVLKHGALMLCFDRSHPDSLTDREVDEKLSLVYSRAFLTANSYQPGIVLTRRGNGEHEYRISEWRAAFENAGFELVNARKLVKRVSFRSAVKGLTSMLPLWMQKRLYNSRAVDLRTTHEWFVQQARKSVGGSGYILAPKETTMFLSRKMSR